MNAHDEILLIAEFMGYDTSRIVSELPVDDRGYYTTENGKYVYIHSLQYNISWNHLIPVVKRIREIINVHLSIDEYFYTTGAGLSLSPYDYDIDQVFESTVEFIKWFNKNKT